MLNLLSKNIKTIVEEKYNLENITEIRLRRLRPLSIGDLYKYTLLDYIVKQEDIDYVISIATKYSLYAYNDQIVDGYIQYKNGIRIGVCGEGVLRDGKLLTQRNIGYLCIRNPLSINKIKCPREILIKRDSVLIISPPGYGKTTLLREIIIEYSKEENILVIDERGELSGLGCIDLGLRTDVIQNIPKSIAYEAVIRSMRPDYIATDELFGNQEIKYIEEVVRSGVKIIASIHGNSLDGIIKSEIYKNLINYFNYFILMTSIGKVEKIYDKSEIKCLL